MPPSRRRRSRLLPVLVLLALADMTPLLRLLRATASWAGGGVQSGGVGSLDGGRDPFFDKLDTNNDRELTLDEMRAEAAAADAGTADADAMLTDEDLRTTFHALDADNSGAVSWIEYESGGEVSSLGPVRDEFDEVDADGDLRLTIAELRASAAFIDDKHVGEEDLKMLWHALDADSSGTVSWREYSLLASRTPEDWDELHPLPPRRNIKKNSKTKKRKPTESTTKKTGQRPSLDEEFDAFRADWDDRDFDQADGADADDGIETIEL